MNQITNSGFTYDSSGDETDDGHYTYAWDAEGRMTSGASVTYTYDGAGERVKDSSPKLSWHGAGGSVLAETDTSGNTVNEHIFFGGLRMARRDSSGNVYYYFGNALGSATITNALTSPLSSSPCSRISWSAFSVGYLDFLASFSLFDPALGLEKREIRLVAISAVALKAGDFPQ